MRSSGKTAWFVILLPLLLGFDWGTKGLVNQHLPVGGEVEVIPGFLSWYHAENPDILFSIPMPAPVIFAGGLLTLAGLLWMLRKIPNDARVQAAALATLGAGAIGNLGDRLLDGTVTDFVRVYTDDPTIAPWLMARFRTATWPIFNVADVLLLVGIGLWFAHGWFEPKTTPEADLGAS